MDKVSANVANLDEDLSKAEEFCVQVMRLVRKHHGEHFKTAEMTATARVLVERFYHSIRYFVKGEIGIASKYICSYIQLWGLCRRDVIRL